MNGDKCVMCFVCGKKFPRGPLDLARHSTAITLMHLASTKAKPNYDFKCSKCHIYFKQQAHLDLHLQNVCLLTRMAKLVTSPSTASNKSCIQAIDVEQSVDENKEEDKTSECMVCGKLFPRGPIDLARHQTGKIVHANIRFIYFYT